MRLLRKEPIDTMPFFSGMGMVVMPGGVDIHCHIAGPKVNLARKLQPEDHRHDVHPRTRHTRSGVSGWNGCWMISFSTMTMRC